MSDPRLDDLAATIEDGDLPAPPPLADIRRRAHRRRSRRHALGGAAIVAFLVAGFVGAGLLERNDAELTTATPPGIEIERFDRVPDGIGTWEFRTSPAIVSRTGEQSGFGLRRVTGADDLLIYLDDGGVCVDAVSCSVSRSSFDGADLEAEFVEADGGDLESLIAAGGPFAGWNVVVVPGITGDFHAGANTDVDVPGGPRDQQFVGAQNLRLALAEVFADDEVRRDQVVLAGSGSAGLGALVEVIDVAEADGSSLAGVVIDGGAIPRLSGQLPACVVQRWAAMGDLTYPDDWDERVGEDEPNNLSGLYRYAADRYPDVEFVLVTNQDDPEMRSLLRAGADTCETPPPDPSPEGFERGIDLLEAELATLPPWSMVIIDGAGSAPIANADDLIDLPEVDRLLRQLADGAGS
jgi:hypothetical protein